MQRELTMMSVCDNMADRTGAIGAGTPRVAKQLYTLRTTASCAVPIWLVRQNICVFALCTTGQAHKLYRESEM